jgi:L-fuculose-phosphate aldolase
MKWKEVGVMSLLGENLTPELKPSIENALHINIYKKNKDVSAVVHAHPVFASSFTAMKTEINTSLTAEARAICGEPRIVPYALMGTEDLAEIVAQNTASADVLLLENHGILTTGSSLLQAFDKLEVLENAAKMTLIVEMTGKKKALGRAQIIQIDRLFR